MTHIQQAKHLSDKIFQLCLPLAHKRLNPGIIAHAMIFGAVRLMLSFAIHKTAHVSEDAAADAFSELMAEINELIIAKFRKLGVPIEGVELGGDVDDPPISTFDRN